MDEIIITPDEAIKFFNENELNKLALEFVRGFSQLEISNDKKTEKEDILDVLYTKLNKLGNLLGFKEPIYWADAYDEFEENKPNYESCVAEINFYLFNITIGRDKKTEGDITRIYKSTHDMYYQSILSLGDFFSFDAFVEPYVIRGKVKYGISKIKNFSTGYLIWKSKKHNVGNVNIMNDYARNGWLIKSESIDGTKKFSYQFASWEAIKQQKDYFEKYQSDYYIIEKTGQ